MAIDDVDVDEAEELVRRLDEAGVGVKLVC